MKGLLQRELGGKLLRAVMLPALAGANLGFSAVLAEPVAKTDSAKVTVARNSTSNTLNLAAARELLQQSSQSAADLKAVPALWDWTNPMTSQRVSQAEPAPVAQAEPTAQAAPAPEDETDILDEVSVTATRRPTRARETPSVVYSLKKDDFRAVNATTVTDALQLVPGFYAAPSGGGIRNAGGVTLRGFDDQRFEVLRDGISLRRSSNNRNDISRFNIEDLERVEVVTGGATLRYGSGAVGGVINLITETPKGPPKLTLRYQVGNYGNSRYSAKYGGGDDTFSYNLIYTGVVAFNDYPFTAQIPREANFYGENDVAQNPSCPDNFVVPAPTAANPNRTVDTFDPVGNPCPNGGLPNGRSLFGFLRPDVGPAVTAQGIANASYAANDTYTAKLTFKPDPINKVTVRFLQQNSKNQQNGPGTYNFGICFGGASAASNGTINFDRFVPLNPDGTEQGCTQQRFLFNTPSTFLAFPYALNASADGTRTFETGKPYQNGVEPLIGAIDFFGITDQSQTEIALQHDWDITPTTSLNSYIYYYRFSGTGFVPPLFAFNSNLLPLNIPQVTVSGGQPFFRTNPPGQPYFEGNKFEIQTALNTQLSPGQNLQFGVNVVQDRSIQQRQGGRSFFDQAITRTSFFLIDDISFGPELKLNLGFRYTYSTQFGVVATPGAGLRYTPTSWLSLRTNWNYVFNAPSISDLNVSGGVFVANPGLRPEAGVAFDTGFDLTPTNNVSLRFTYFNIYLDGAIGTRIFANQNFGVAGDPTSGFPFLQRQDNLNTQTAQGYELLANWQINEQVGLQLNWTNVDRRNQGFVDSINTQLFTYQIQAGGLPFNNVGIRATYNNKGYLFALIGRYLDGFTLDYTTRTPSFFTLDFTTEVPLTPFFTLTGSVFNLTDTRYENPVGVPAPGPTFLVGGRVEIGG